MRPVSRRHSRRGLVGGSTFRRTPISRSPLDKNPMPGHLSELQPVNAVNTKGQFFRASFGINPRFHIQLDKRPLSPGTSREAGGVPCLNPRRGLTLLSPVCRDPAIGVMQPLAFPPDWDIFAGQDDCDQLWLLLEGEVEIIDKDGAKVGVHAPAYLNEG